MFSVCCKQGLASGSSAAYSYLAADWVCFMCLFSQIPPPIPAQNRTQSAKETFLSGRENQGLLLGGGIGMGQRLPTLNQVPLGLVWPCSSPATLAVFQRLRCSTQPLQVLFPLCLAMCDLSFGVQHQHCFFWKSSLTPALHWKQGSCSDFSPFESAWPGVQSSSSRLLTLHRWSTWTSEGGCRPCCLLCVSFKHLPSSVIDIHLCSCLVSITYTKISRF